MSVNIKKSFRFIFEDKDWPQKVAIGGVFFLATFIINTLINILIQRIVSFYGIEISQNNLQSIQSLVNSLVSIPILATALGYIIHSGHNEIKDESPLLPVWDNKFLDYFKHGIIFYLVNFIYVLGLVIIAGILSLIMVLVARIFNTQVNLASIAVIVAVVGIFYTAISPFITVTYADRFNFVDALKLNLIIERISRTFPAYLISLGISLGVLVLWLLLNIILTCTCIGVIIPPFLIFVVYLITVNLFSQVYKESQNI